MERLLDVKKLWHLISFSLLASSALSIHLAEQGLKIPVRHKPRKRLTAIGTTSLRGKASSKRRRGSSTQKSGTRLKRVVEEEDGDANEDNDEDNDVNEEEEEEENWV